MYAIAEVGGKQYRIEKDMIVYVDKVVDEGESFDIDKILLFVDDAKMLLGKPYLTNVKVKTSVLGIEKGKKVVGVKFKRRKNFQRTKGHRAEYLKLKIDDVAIA